MQRGHEKTAVLVSMPSEAEAALLVQALRSRGIPAEAVGALTSGFRAEAPGGSRFSSAKRTSRRLAISCANFEEDSGLCRP